MLILFRYLASKPIQWDNGSETELILMSDAHNVKCINMSDIEPQMLIIFTVLTRLVLSTSDYKI